MSYSVCVQVELRKQDHTHVRTCTGNNITGSAVQFAMHLYTQKFISLLFVQFILQYIEVIINVK